MYSVEEKEGYQFPHVLDSAVGEGTANSVGEFPKPTPHAPGRPHSRIQPAIHSCAGVGGGGKADRTSPFPQNPARDLTPPPAKLPSSDRGVGTETSSGKRGRAPGERASGCCEVLPKHTSMTRRAGASCAFLPGHQQRRPPRRSFPAAGSPTRRTFGERQEETLSGVLSQETPDGDLLEWPPEWHLPAESPRLLTDPPSPHPPCPPFPPPSVENEHPACVLRPVAVLKLPPKPPLQ